ncbi:hypothetical protein [Teredinibacter purpureus]|uniref:hypothetical protein n=1 Tax=Teredinibacter purpureus TaxID=2731756 RepID=UPI0005F7DBD8|nr:hypothetical protein [Teredinibacter purpureus]
MKFFAAFIFGVLIIGCSNNSVVTLGGNGHRIKILDDLSKSEGEMVASFVTSKMEVLRSEYISVDAKVTDLYSISKWHTPGMQSDEEKKCKYSANFYYGGFGNAVCIGVHEVNDQEIKLKVLWSTSWIS